MLHYFYGLDGDEETWNRLVELKKSLDNETTTKED